jgi:hypothetical protein
MPIQRSSLYIGPGMVTHAGHSFQSKGAISLPIELETIDVGTEAHGPRIFGRPPTRGMRR